jgi:hypothetical protein
MSARELDGLVLQLKGVVYARAVLEDRGAAPAAIATHEAEIERLRNELAEQARESAVEVASPR